MTSPVFTVAVLAVLWLIVVVPMVMRRKDQRAGERSVRSFRSAMRALASRRSGLPDPDDAPKVLARASAPAASVSVPTRTPSVTTRRPVPVARESLRYASDRQMSEARRRMLVRRRRALVVLMLGTVAFSGLAVIRGGMLWWSVAGLFALALCAYVYLLRALAIRDQERRETVRTRAAVRPSRSYDATADPVRPLRPETVVHIDDEDVELMQLDTVDLTGLYNEADEDVPVRRAG
jgi:membrane protein YdbS with pleckstrin-like domain